MIESINIAFYVGVEIVAIIAAIMVVTILRRLGVFEKMRQSFGGRFYAWQEKRWMKSVVLEREENRRINGDPYSDLKSEAM